MKNPFLDDEKTHVVVTGESTSPSSIVDHAFPATITSVTATADTTGTTSFSSSPITSSTSPLKQEQGLPPPPPPAIAPHKPNKGRLVIRCWQAIAAVGAFGFQIGASPYAGIPFLFEDAKLQYYTYAIDLVSFLWALFMLYVYLTRRFSSGQAPKVKRLIAFTVDAMLATLFGVASFYQFASYPCPPGQYHGWCHFHNTGLFFLVSLFLSYTIMMCWDLFGGCTCLRDKKE